MRIAVTYEDGQVFQHFGHTEQFKIYDVEDGKIVNAVVVPTNGSGHGALAGFSDEGQRPDLRRYWRRCESGAGRGWYPALPRCCGGG